MFQNSLPAITSLFSGAGRPREPVKFAWRLVRRRKRPFLLLPDVSSDVRVSLGLYSAQRPLARIWSSVLPWLFKTPARNFFGIVNVEADASSELLQFLAVQSGQPLRQMQTPAIKFGGVADKSSRLVLLLCDTAGHPIRVIKLGLNPQGRAVTEREADLLAQLPKDVIGCTTMTGRLNTGTFTAFATAYFPGESLANDVGIEKLFHAWLVQGFPEALENLSSWHELETAIAQIETRAWPLLRDALAGQKVSATLYHGDFTPWNVRMTNLESIQAFDWERGHLKGIPAWDWFHFIVQTSILVKRHSPERVAAELDQLIQSPRFQNYAVAAGISQIVEPLLLAYLLHEKYVIQPLEGGEVISELFDLLWTESQLVKKAKTATRPDVPLAPLVASSPVARPAVVGVQLKSAFMNLANLFWEPSLSPRIRPPFQEVLGRHWLALLLSLAWIIGIANLPLLISPYLMFSPFYLVPCIFLALKTDRRLATLVAQLSAAFGPLVFYYSRPDFTNLTTIVLNITMRMIVFQLVVVLFDRIGRQSVLYRSSNAGSDPLPVAALAGNWPVILLTTVFFALVIALDIFTDPNLLLMPLYMIPCMVLTLALDWRWGTVVAVLAAIVGPVLQRPDKGYQSLGVEFWNTAMRLVIYEMVVVLLERVRRENILFSTNKRQ